MHRDRKSIFWLLLVAVGATAFGIVLAGSLHLTPPTMAEKAVPAPAVTSTAASPARSIALPSFADIADQALNSVVSITSTEIVKTQGSPFGDGNSFGQGDPFEFFFGPRRGTPQERKQVAGGSGFIVSADGEILTNNHVVAGAQKIQVKLRDKEILQARVIGRDPATDVALIKVDTKTKLTVLALGDSDKIRVGEWVMAVGNPLAFEGTVTVGVISGKGRSGLSQDSSLENFIQTDAAINFGNSGGPLINAAGQVVGINTAMIQPAQNIGFAVPINTAKSDLPQLKSKGKVTRGLLGVRIGPVDQDIMQAFHLPSMDGAFVEMVDPNQPAAKAGVEHGDTIIRADDVEVKEPRDVITYVSSQPPGAKVKLTVLRDGKQRAMTVTLAEREAPEGEDVENAGAHGNARGRLGISVTDLSPNVRQQLEIPSDVAGVVIDDVGSVSAAADKGLTEGDVITEINGVAVHSVSQFRSEMDKTKKGDYVRIYVRRFHPQEISRYVVFQPE